MEYSISALLGYLFGSFPTAFLVMKKATGVDITAAGSGNVGAMNTYEVSGSKLIGFLVFLIDAAKGIVPVLLTMYLFELTVFPAIALLFAVFGHCFSVWLKFKGGRGLATAAGGSFIIAPYIFVVWAVLWVIIYFMKKDILLANISSTILTILAILTGSSVAVKYSSFKPEEAELFLLFAVSVLLIIFIKHMEPLRELIETKTKMKTGKENDNN